MDSCLVELYRHNLWANLRLLDACASLNDEQLDASAPGTYGRVRDTLLHILSAEARYAAVLAEEQPAPPGAADPVFPSFEELRARARRSGERMIAMAEGIQPPLELRGTMQGIPYTVQAGVLVLQALNHATEHRAHVVSILSQIGVAPPAVDGWAYAEEHGLLRMGPT